jgi:hypothetical protein
MTSGVSLIHPALLMRSAGLPELKDAAEGERTTSSDDIGADNADNTRAGFSTMPKATL